MTRLIRCRCCGRPGHHKGHGYREACWRRWSAAGRPADGPPMPVAPSDRPYRTAADADELRTRFAGLRDAGLTIPAAAARLRLSFSTANRYEASRRGSR